MEWLAEEADLNGALMFVYDGGVLSPGQIDAIELPAAELSSYQFVGPSELHKWVTPANQQRAVQALKALSAGSVVEIDRLDPSQN